MTDQEVNSLFEKFKAGTCTPEERGLLLSWYNKVEGDSRLPDELPDFDKVEQRMWDFALSTAQERKQLARHKITWYLSVAATIALLISVGLYFYTERLRSKAPIASRSIDIPGIANKATLLLANGQQIILDDAKTGEIASQGGVSISKNAKGQIVYDVSNLSSSGKDGEGQEGDTYNIIKTPNGGQYQVILPDGSIVYLNAASSLKYPVKFAANDRKVSLSGEGYFEITKNTKRPFLVTTQHQTIKVLGTHFNVSSYPDEPIVTTLAEGKVEISSRSFPQKTVLRPGDQSIAGATGFTTTKVNPIDIIAWTEGLFVFSNTDLKDVMRQIARCYNVEVDYASIPNVKYEGEISRNTTLLKVLKFIEAGSDVPLKLEGRRIMRK